jgi:hypothetical protein
VGSRVAGSRVAGSRVAGFGSVKGRKDARFKRTKVTFLKSGYVANILINGVISRDASLHSSLSSILEMV